MKRRLLIKNAIGLSLAAHPLKGLLSMTAGKTLQRQTFFNGPAKPVTVYNNWSAYDELSDVIPLTEELAMRELNELIRLKKNGVQFDCYVMDAFWFDKSGGYRIWHKERWPNGPGKWLNACKANGIKPGMWFSTNDLIRAENGNFLDTIPEWKDSATANNHSLCLFRGGYLKHLADTLQLWADKGVKVFKFDFADFGAATAEAQQLYLPSEIEERNKLAFIDVLKQLRLKNPGILLIAYNGFGGHMRDTFTPFRKSVDSRWLEVFDTMYCGDPRFSDVPTMNIWRSMDIYSDHTVRQYQLNSIPVNRIDNCGFMIGVTGTCYKRANNAWKGMQVLEFARGGWMNVFHGNLELLTDDDAKWFARSQSMFLNLQQYATASTFGELPGSGKAYGFMFSGSNGKVCTVVNPSQEFTEIQLPVTTFKSSALIYTDGGFKPLLTGNKITLGPEQLAVVGFDEYSNEQYSLGTDDTISIPSYAENVSVIFKETGHNTITGTVNPVKDKNIRILLQQFGEDGYPKRTFAGAPPNGKKMDSIIKIKLTQNGRHIPLNIQYDKMIWSGLSWASGEASAASFKADVPLDIECITTETEKLKLKAAVYAVSY